MNCPECNRSNAVTLSICPSCGAMINDSVREELRDKISPIVKKINLERTPLIPNKIETPAPAPYKPVQQMAIPKPQIPVLEKSVEKTITMELAVKPTAPTLVEFQNKKADLPEWRMQLKNSVLKRQNRANTEAANVDFSTVAPAKLVTSGANALKVRRFPNRSRSFIQIRRLITRFSVFSSRAGSF